MSIAYKTKEITSRGLVRVYEVLGVLLKGDMTIKILTDESGGHNFFQPGLIKDLVNRLSRTIVEYNAAYPGGRNTTQAHWETIRDHGFLATALCNILDKDSDMAIPVENGFHLQESYVGTHLKNYNSMAMPPRLKGHAMGGFGGALKNISIGLASSRGRTWIRTSGTSNVFKDAFVAGHDSSLESMADADRSVMDLIGREKIVHIDVVNRLSMDCNCDVYPYDSEVTDISILASADPIALSQASVDAAYGSEDAGRRALAERMESCHEIHTVEAARAHDPGNRKYELVYIG